MAELKHVLCVDDEPDILEVVQLVLENMGGLKVSCANGGAKALAWVADNVPDLILMDVMMPGMDGPMTLGEMQKLPQLEGVPIVFMTARVQAKEVREYLALGADAVISKPFNPMTLVSEIKAIWAKKRA
ncbi:chemotaxis protein CheY [Asticcacaulis sp. AC460]|uniref:response regulator n=1 Tax=Asticcacaulis sp. AC460 TaxID=1282360 RepID=UPI0003C3CF9E|nr:response regulator [Asticcacaulis sp. AC460]ESQ87737.1 chemotaxis protein CheY [Asticcacaulis sp. AC460]